MIFSLPLPTVRTSIQGGVNVVFVADELARSKSDGNLKLVWLYLFLASISINPSIFYVYTRIEAQIDAAQYAQDIKNKL